MATQEQLLAALGEAHAAKNENAAIEIAEMLHSGQYDPSTPPTIEQPGGNTSGGAPPAGSQYDPSAGGAPLAIGPFNTGIHMPQGVDRFLSGAGQAVVDTGKGLAQVAGLRSRADVDEDRRINAPLDATGAGLAGNVAGGAAMWALPGMGAAKALGAASKVPGLVGAGAKIASAVAPEIGGGAIGAVAPVESSGSRLRNAAFGAAAAGAGSALGDTAQSVVRSGVDAVSPAARTAYTLAQKYGINLTVPQLSKSTLLRHYSNLTDALPFTGSDARAAAQRGQFNDAVGRLSGIPQAHGAITPDALDDAKDLIGNSIGTVASAHAAIPTQSNIRGMMNVVHDARSNATPQNIQAVESKVQQLLAHVDPSTGTIPGDAWRQANTALQRQIRSETDGDLKHYLGGLQDHFMDMMEQGIPHGTFDAWQGLRGQYRNLKSIEPLVEKGGNEGLSPALLRQRLITAKNNRGDLSDLADLGQEQIKQAVPNSGTAQKSMIATGVGLGGAHFAGLDPYSLSAVGANILGNRALNSNLAAKYYMGRLPASMAKYADPALESLGPGAAAASSAEAPQRDAALNDIHQAGESGALAGHADGGAVYQKSSIWDLAKQGWRELTSTPDSQPQNPNQPPRRDTQPGTIASGTKGADFDRWVDRNVEDSQ